MYREARARQRGAWRGGREGAEGGRTGWSNCVCFCGRFNLSLAASGRASGRARGSAKAITASAAAILRESYECCGQLSAININSGGDAPGIRARGGSRPAMELYSIYLMRLSKLLNK